MEARRLDKLEEAIGKSGDTAATLVYALRVCQELVVHRGFRQQVRTPSLTSRWWAEVI